MKTQIVAFIKGLNKSRAVLIVLLAGVVPIIIGAFIPSLFDLLRKLFFYFLIFYPFVVLVKVFTSSIEHNESLTKSYLRYVNFIPAGTVYSSTLAKQKIPFITIMLIVVNSLIFWQFSEVTVDRFVFYPYGDPSFLDVILAFFTSAFLHANISHLLGNMFFLWAFGCVIEGRLGHLRYLGLYFLFIISSKMLNTIFIFIMSLGGSDSFITLLQNYHSLGASGAISGVMGVYVIRCYFSSVKVAVPFLLMPFISLSLQVQGVVLVIFFFSRDVDAGLHHMASSNIGHWSHLGGYFCGITVAWLLGFHLEAVKEAREYKTEIISRKYLGRVDAVDKYQAILQDSPNNIKALKYLLSVHSYNEEKECYYYVRLLEILSVQDFEGCIDLFRQVYPKHVRNTPPRILVKLGSQLLKDYELDKAKVCLEFAVDHKGVWQPKAFMLLAETYFIIDNIALARRTWESVMTTFPLTPFAEEAERKLAKYLL